LSQLPDRMDLLGIEVQARHGVLQAEKETEQAFRIDVSLWSDFENAQRDDDLSAALDYSSLHDFIGHAVMSSYYELIEALAGHLCRLVLTKFKVSEVSITVTKVKPPIAGFHGTAAVTLRRGKSWLTSGSGKGFS